MNENEEDYNYSTTDFNLEEYLERLQTNYDYEQTGILLLPNENWRQLGHPVFMPETSNLLKWVTQNPSIEVDICRVEMDEIRIADLRSYDIWLPILYIFGDTSFQLTLNIVANYIYDRMRGLLPNEDPKIHLEILNEEDGVIRRFTYDGSATDLKQIAKKVDLNKLLEK